MQFGNEQKRGENENSNPLDLSMFPLFFKEGLGELEIEKLYFTPLDNLYILKNFLIHTFFILRGLRMNSI